MTGVACFADEAGIFTPWSRICVAVVCLVRDEGVSLERLGFRLVERLRSLLGWKRGELKWRSVKKAARRRGIDPRLVATLVAESSFACAAVDGHLASSDAAGELKLRLLEEALVSLRGCLGGLHPLTLILDANLVPRPQRMLPRIRRLVGANFADTRDSAKHLGLQLADVYAGACTEGLVERGVWCGGRRVEKIRGWKL